MPQTDAAAFKVKHLQVLDEQGQLLDPNPPDLSPDKMKELFRMMVLIRELDAMAINYQRQGRMGTYAPVAGQEACQVGSAAALNPEDWVFPAFREQGVMMMHGISIRDLLLYFMGCEEGNRTPEDNRTFPISVPVASQIPIAVGTAMAMKYKKDKGAVVTYFSDGATSEGDFSEGMNFASVFKVPCVFICQNNQWAISVPREFQTAAKTLAQKAIAYEMEALQVDGNDILAVYQASQWALHRARNGEGPSFLELVTYRQSMHTTADDPKKYRDPAIHEQWMKKDPIMRFENYLISQKIIDEHFKDSIQEEADSLLKKAFEEADEVIKNMKPEDSFLYSFAEMPPNLREQMEELKKFIEETS